MKVKNKGSNKAKIDQYYQEWQRCIEKININSAYRPILMIPWEGSHQIDHQSGTAVYLYSKVELEKRREVNRELIEIARPYMENLSLAFWDSPLVVLLADKDGY